MSTSPKRRTLVANLVGHAYRANRDGVEYLVAPATLLTPGVHIGSKGRLYYPREEIAATYQLWDKVPVTLNHPFIAGKPASANDESVIQRQGIGFISLPKVSVAGNLIANLWVDIKKANALDNRLVKTIEGGKPVELSTGLFTTNEQASGNAVFNGEGYDYVAKSYKPDHLAILLDQEGACSLRDGCGVLINTQNTGNSVYRNQGMDPDTRNRVRAIKQKAEQLGLTINGWVTIRGHHVLLGADTGGGGGGSKKSKSGVGVSGGSKKSTEDAPSSGEVKSGSKAAKRAAADGSSTTDNVSNGDYGMDRASMVDFLVNEKSCVYKPEDREALEKLSDSALKATYDSAHGIALNNAANEGAKELSHNQQKTNVVEPVVKKEQTEEEWLQTAPPSIRATVLNAKREAEAKKQAIIEKMVANVAEDQKDPHRKRLSTRSIEDLEADLAIMPQSISAKSEASFFGSQGVANSKPVINKADYLPIPE